MKINYPNVFILILLFPLIYSCTTTRKSLDIYEKNITNIGIYQKPAVADLSIAKEKKSLTRTYINIPEDEAREYIMAEFVMNENCDAIVHPVYELTETNGALRTKTDITITGFPAQYKNIRNFDFKTDTGAIKLFLSTNLYDPNKSRFPLTNIVNQKVEKISPKINFGISAGTTFANQSTSSVFGGQPNSSDFGIGYSFGFFSNIRLSKKIFLQPAINYTQKVSTMKNFQKMPSSPNFNPEFPNYNPEFPYLNSELPKKDSRLTLNYLEIPVNFIFQPKHHGLFFGLGLSAGIALNGSRRIDGKSEPVTIGGKEGNEFNQFEAGLNILAGFKFRNQYSLNLNYNYGGNISSQEDIIIYNSYFGLRLGYEF